MQNDVVETFNANGEPESFRAFSSRLKEFLEIYPPTDGYRMVVTTTDMLSVKTGLASLYRTAIESGHNPVQMGLPDSAQFSPQIVFRAELLKDDLVISSASSFGEVEYPDKSWETLETNAKSRLMAGLGVGYDLLDADEERQQEQLQKAPKRKKTAKKAPKLAAAPEAKLEKVEPVAAKKSEHTETVSPAKMEIAEDLIAPANSSKQQKSPNNSEFPFADNATEEISLAVLRQLKTLAINKGVHVNPVTNKDEAKKERKRLMLLS